VQTRSRRRRCRRGWRRQLAWWRLKSSSSPWDLRWDPVPGAPAVSVLDRQPNKGVLKVDECDLAEIGNSKEETRGTQFRQVRAARCVIPYILYVAYLWIDWMSLQDGAYMRERVPASPYIVRKAGLQVGLGREY
jgi:hypothetical protein